MVIIYRPLIVFVLGRCPLLAQNPKTQPPVRSDSKYTPPFCQKPAVPRLTRLSTTQAARILSLASHLQPSDRTLLLLAIADGKSHAQLSTLLGIPARSVARRIRILARRVLHPAFAYAVLHLDTFDPPTRDIARRCIIDGSSIRAAALALNLSQYRVRLVHANLLAMAGAASHTAALIHHRATRAA